MIILDLNDMSITLQRRIGEKIMILSGGRQSKIHTVETGFFWRPYEEIQVAEYHTRVYE